MSSQDWLYIAWGVIFFALGYSNAWLSGLKKAKRARELGRSEGYMKRVDEEDGQ